MDITLLGQPQAGHLDFDVKGFEIVKEGSTVEGNVLEILDPGEPFTLRLDFEGSGPDWINMCNERKGYIIHFDAEGIGPTWSWTGGHSEIHLGDAVGQLNPNDDDYKIEFEVSNGIPNRGVYRLSAMVTFKITPIPMPNPPPPIDQWVDHLGVLGFAEGLLLQVHPAED